MNTLLAHIEACDITFMHAADDRPDGADFPPHIHNTYELYTFVEGSADYTVEDEMYALRPYDMLLIRPSQFHCLHLKAAKPYRRMVFHFPAESVLPETAPLLRQGGYFRPGRDGEIADRLYKLCDYAAKRDRSDAEALLPNILSEILIDIKYLPPEPSETGIAGTAAAIAAFVNEHIREPLSVASVAERLYLSPSYVSHVFSARYRMGLMQFVRRKKVYEAEKLLKSGLRPVEAAETCGFNDYATFYRAYRQILGRTPKEDGR